MPFIPHTPEESAAMLQAVGLNSLDDLFAGIPADMRPKSFNLPDGLSESQVCGLLESLAAKNLSSRHMFLGAGFYNHSIPKAVDALCSRGEFFTAYTPYQPEAAQGTLQAIFEYQTAMARLLGMDIANASVYDGGSAIFEAAMMAVRATRRRIILVDEAVNPLYRSMLATLTANVDVEIKTIPHKRGLPDLPALGAAINSGSAALIVQNPCFFGAVVDYTDLFSQARQAGALNILSVYPVMQAVLKTPGEMGADIAVADGQSLGQPLGFGGPYLGIMACSKDLVRQMPGRIVGRTEDLEGKTGYVLTLQAREQHIRRAKATSNICSNQALCALRALIHICLLGPEGLTRTAELGMERARKAADALCALPGVKMLNDAPYGNEFAVVLPKPADELVDALLKRDVMAGAPLGLWYGGLQNALLVACTEQTSDYDIECLKKAMGAIL